MTIHEKITLRPALSAAAALAVVGGIAGVVVAQTLPRNNAEFEAQIGITPAQKTKMKSVADKYTPRLKQIDAKYRPQVESLRRQMQDLAVKAQAEAKPILDQQRNEMQAILTPAQREKAKKISAALQQQAMQAQQAGGAMGGLPTTPKR